VVLAEPVLVTIGNVDVSVFVVVEVDTTTVDGVVKMVEVTAGATTVPRV